MQHRHGVRVNQAVLAELAIVAPDSRKVAFGQDRAGMLLPELRVREGKVVVLDHGVPDIGFHKEFVQRERGGGLSRPGGSADE